MVARVSNCCVRIAHDKTPMCLGLDTRERFCVHGGGTVHGLLVAGRTRPLAQPIALPGHLHDGRVREEAIEDRGRGREVAEKMPQSCVGRFNAQHIVMRSLARPRQNVIWMASCSALRSGTSARRSVCRWL
jgi:hypothetical protein